MLRFGRLVVTVLAVVGLQLLHPNPAEMPLAGSILLFTALVATILLASFGVLTEANALARRFGEPYGSLVLTLSVVIIEVVMISAVLLGPSPAPTIARDSIFSVMMIIFNLVVGTALVVGYRRNGPQSYNPVGTRIYLVLIVVLAGWTFLGPLVFRPYTASFPSAAALITAVVVGFGYGVFLFLQMGRWRRLFEDEPSGRVKPRVVGPTQSILQRIGDSVPVRFGLLIALLVLITLLSEHLAVLIDFGVQGLGLPVAFGGIVIAAIVFTPETLTAIKAAASNEMQRVVNLCLGAFVSTVGLSVPSVLVIGAVTGREVTFGLAPVDVALLVATVALLVVTYTRRRTSVQAGLAHLGLFALFIAAVFAF
ncbi:calcium:proton antiporter [Actinomyces minihominis]|uniref:calcium:proton antiporter n=1 Tax=Actinomyces minihominis TaxID=2002838 RepID=UPI000C0694EC|nr:calcium:proton antiporter [Actinomyces minihominis]